MFCKILIILNIVSVLECMDHQYFTNDSTNQMNTEQGAIVKRDIERQDRIYGGEKCPAQEFKTIVSIREETPMYQNHTCGATLINRNWVLTAAHCYSSEIRTYYAVTGITTSGDTKPVVSKVAKWYLHKEYKPEDTFTGNDMALFLLEKSIEETEYIKYVKLPTKDLGDIRQFCSQGLVKGWGAIEGMKGPKTEQELQCLDVPINNYDCRNDSKDTFICYIHQNATGTSCWGDSGGPLMCKGIQVGVASFATIANEHLTFKPMKCIPSMPQGYTRVDKYLGFINNVMETHTPRKGNSPNVNCMSIFMWFVVFLNVFRQFLQTM